MIATKFSDLTADIQKDLLETLSKDELKEFIDAENFERSFAKISSVYKINLINNTYSIYTLETTYYKFEVIGIEYNEGSFKYDIKFCKGVLITPNTEIKVNSFNWLPLDIQKELYLEFMEEDETFDEFYEWVNDIYESMSEFVKGLGHIDEKGYYLCTKNYRLRFNTDFKVSIIKK